MKFQSVKGTHDIVGENLSKYNFIIKKISELAKIYNYDEIITPIFESSELFQKNLGENSDVVLKEMYTFNDRGNNSLTLRPEYTTSMIRAAISNNLLEKLPTKLFGYGPMFRRERPQKGRYRQFNQINFEILGVNESYSDAEIIILANNFLKEVISNKDVKLSINSLGDLNTLSKYRQELSSFFEKFKSDLSEDSKDKIYKNPLRILDSKNANDNKLSLNAPKIYDYYSKFAKKNFDEVQKYLDNANVPFIVNPNLVRGLDYYCHTVFEFKTNSLGSQDTLIGGGRYDGLINLIGGPDIPGVGFACGIERLMLLSNNILEESANVQIIIIDKDSKNYGFDLINNLRQSGIATIYDFKHNLKKSLSSANQKKVQYVIIIGEDESKNSYYTLKNLINGTQSKKTYKEILTLLKK
jgi:histidyl-tRNA synthetase